MLDRYNVSKLLQLYCIRELASLFPVENTSVVLNLINPGMCTTELNRNIRGVASVVVKVMRALLARTSEEGSRNLVFAAEVGEASHGKYVTDCVINEQAVSRGVRSEEGGKVQREVWRQTRAKLVEMDPKIDVILVRTV